MLENEKYHYHPLIVKRVWHGGGKKYWIEEGDTRQPVAHMDNLVGFKYAYIFTASPLLLNCCYLVLERLKLDALTRDTIEFAVRSTMPVS